MANEREVKYRLTGDVSELQAALNSAESDFEDLGRAGRSIVVLENALANVQKFEAGVQAAQAKVNALKSALSEAYAADAEAPQIKKLERDLGSAERAATKAQTALDRANAAIVGLNLEAGKTGVSTANLAARKQQLAIETDKVRAKMEALAAQAKKTAEAENQAAAQAGRLNSAFATLNIRSAQQINADIQKINESLAVLARSASVSGAEFDRAYANAQQQIARLKNELAGANEESGKTVGIMGRLRGAFGGLQGVLAALGIGAVGEEFVAANLAAERLGKALTAITGSAAKAASETKFLRDISARLGLDFEAASNGFIKFAAATKGTTLEGQKARDVFASVAGAMSQLGLSAVDQERALNALGQMMSKGTVTAEELKGQLGDVLPGAFQIAAKAVGVTTAELGKMMEQGGVMADTFLPRFADELKKSFGNTGEVEGLAAAFNRVKNQWNELSVAFGEAGALDVLKAGLGALNAVLMVVFSTIGIVVTGFLGFGKALGVVAAAIARMDFDILREGLAEVGGEIDKSLQHFADLSNQSLGLKKATDEVGQSASAAGKAVAEAGPSFEKLQVIFGDLSKAAAEASQAAEQNADARKAEGAAAIAAAQAFGTEVEQRNALAAAAEANATASGEVAKARQYELGIAQAHLAQVRQDIAATGQETEAQRKLVEQLTAKVAERQAAADKATAEAAGTKLAADAAVLATQTYKDNSAALDQLRANAAAASSAVESLRAQKSAGIEVSAQLTAAESAEAQAKALYRDAISDQIEKINALASAKQAEINLGTAQIRLAIEQQKAAYESARAWGNEYEARQALIEIKRLEIKLAELTAKAKRAEAEAAIALAKAKREELAATGQLTPAKEAELKAIEASAQVKKVEADIAEVTASKLKDLALASEQVGTKSSRSSKGVKELADSIKDVSDAADDAEDSLNGMNNAAGKSGGKKKENTTFSGTINHADVARKAGFTEAEISAASGMFQTYIDQEFKRFRYQGVGRLNLDLPIERGVAEAIRAARAQGMVNEPSRGGIPSSGIPGDTKNNGLENARSFRIDINLGGKQRAVNVSSPQDAANLRDIFRLIESDASRSF